MCIDFLGAVAARLVADNKAAEEEEAGVHALVMAAREVVTGEEEEEEEEAGVHALVMAAREAVTGGGWRKGGGVGSSGGGTTSCAKLIV